MNLDTCHVMAEKILSEVDGEEYTDLFAGKNGVYTLNFAFRESGIPDLLNDYSYLKPFIDATVETDRFNAFYMNALVIKNGNSVKRHVDTTLSDWIGFRTEAEKVSVLYLRVPDDMIGGELNIYHEHTIESIKPETGKLVSFDGNVHEVCTTFTDHERVSLVLESYYLMGDSYSRVPKYEKV